MTHAKDERTTPGSRRDRFASEWLGLREPADHAARAAALVQRIPRWSGPQEPWRILDLAAGQGSNMCYLAPRLPGRQQWLLTDRDSRLLEAAAVRCAGLESLDGQPAEARTERLDLRDRSGLSAVLEDFSPGLVTASALLDLVSDDWLTALANLLSAHRLPVLFALNYNGHMSLTPSAPDDLWLQAEFNRHQLEVGSFGASLGPSASAYARRLFQNRGYEVVLEPADWFLESRDSALVDALLRGWVNAVSEYGPEHARRAERWLTRAHRRLTEGARIRVGHMDLLAVPTL